MTVRAGARTAGAAVTTSQRIAVLLTCHNRVERTLACLASLTTQVDADGAHLDIVLVDAGSTDGTREAVEARFPEVSVICRGPELFWNGGMRVAFAHAYSTDPDLYLWLNDDVVLDDDVVSTLLATHHHLLERRPVACIVAGSTRDPDSGETTYGGVVRPSRTRPLHYQVVEPGGEPRRVETMNGNCVLVPREVAAAIGTLAEVYTHGMGDFDYGHRAQRAGCEVWIAPRTIGTCSRNPPPGPEISLEEHRRRVTSPTGGLPPREWATFARRWAGPLWPLYAISPYIRRFVRWIAAR